MLADPSETTAGPSRYECGALAGPSTDSQI